MYVITPAVTYMPVAPVPVCAWARVTAAITICAQLALLQRGMPPSDIIEMLPEPNEGHQWKLAA